MAAINHILPSPLKKGDTIGIVAPAGKIQNKDIFYQGLAILEELGFRTYFPRDLWPGQDYLADSDERRCEEFVKLWCKSDVNALMAARGGFGCLRIADKLDLQAIQKQAKIFIGFSDISLLHSIINEKTGIITCHGPVVTSLPNLTKESIDVLEKTLYQGFQECRLFPGIEILRSSPIPVRGVTTGGNLSTAVSTLGTPFEPHWAKKIVFLEDTCEYTYKIDKMFTQLYYAGKLNDISAVVLGDFSHGLNLDKLGVMRHHETIWQRVLELTGEDTAVWARFPISHGIHNITIPFGIDAILDCSKSHIIFK